MAKEKFLSHFISVKDGAEKGQKQASNEEMQQNYPTCTKYTADDG